MKKIFEFEEKAISRHRIEITINDDIEEEYENYIASFVDKINRGDISNTNDIIINFDFQFGVDGTKFIENVNKRTEFECL